MLEAPPFSKFMHKTLLPEEKIVRSAHFPGIYVLISYITLLTWAVSGAVVEYLVQRYLGFNTYVPILVCAVAGFFHFLFLMIRMWTTEIVLTDRRIIYKTGYFNVRAQEVDIEQLASQNVAQNFLGRLLDYGAVYIRCIEASDIYLPPVSRAYEFVNALEQQKQHYRDLYSKGVRVRQHGMGPGDS